MAVTDLGKKVFFLYPPSVIRDEMIGRLLDQEYEVYMLKDIKMCEPCSGVTQVPGFRKHRRRNG